MNQSYSIKYRSHYPRCFSNRCSHCLRCYFHRHGCRQPGCAAACRHVVLLLLSSCCCGPPPPPELLLQPFDNRRLLLVLRLNSTTVSRDCRLLLLEAVVISIGIGTGKVIKAVKVVFTTTFVRRGERSLTRTLIGDAGRSRPAITLSLLASCNALRLARVLLLCGVNVEDIDDIVTEKIVLDGSIGTAAFAAKPSLRTRGSSWRLPLPLKRVVIGLLDGDGGTGGDGSG